MMGKKLNKKKLTILVCIILLIVLISICTLLYKFSSSCHLFFDEYVFRKNIIENKLPSLSNENFSVFAFDGNILVLDKSVLTFYSKSAVKISSLDIEISDPIFKSSGKYLCIAERNGSKFYLISDRTIIWQKSIDGSISTASVNSNGYVALAIADTTYKNICKVFSPSGSELFTNYLSTSYIIDLSLSNDNKFLALAEANFEGITVQSNIKIISIDEALSNPYNSIIMNYPSSNNSLIVNVEYTNSGLICIYNNHTDFIKDNNSCTEITNFDLSDVLFADINDTLVQIEKNNNSVFSSNFEVEIFNSNLSNTKVYTLNAEPKSLDVFDNIIAINFGTDIFFINNNAWLIKHYTASHEIQDVIISNGIAGIVFKDKIEFLSL